MSAEHEVTFWVDGGCLGKNPSPQGVYWSVRCKNGAINRVVERSKSGDFHTNNDAEWLALRAALTYATQHFSPTSAITVYSDSRLVVHQYNGLWRTTHARHLRFRVQCHLLAQPFRSVTVEWKPRKVMVARLGH